MKIDKKLSKQGTYYLLQFDFIEYLNKNKIEGLIGIKELKQCLLDFYNVINSLLDDYSDQWN